MMVLGASRLVQTCMLITLRIVCFLILVLFMQAHNSVDAVSELKEDIKQEMKVGANNK